ncbi:MAG: SDR family oxidoreductase [Phycisphaerales bacterium]
MDTNLTGKRALVGGSTQGIGRAAAFELASLGAAVTLIARNSDALAKVAAELPKPAGQQHGFVVADFADPESLGPALRPLLDPTKPVHILINNTGGPPGGPAHDAAPEAFLVAFKTHLVSFQVLVKALLPGMRAAAYGRIINIISTSVKAPIPNLGVSNTIRAAVANWGKTLAHELGPFGITVNNVLPGFTDTARLAELFKARAAKTGKAYQSVVDEAISTIPAGRLGKPEEIAAAVGFLASPAASYVNGINLPVDGGRTQSL